MGKTAKIQASEFIEEGAKVVDAKSEPVKEETPQEPPKEPYVLPDALKPDFDLLKKECEKLGERARMLDAMVEQKIIQNPTVFRLIDEIMVADFIRNVSDFYKLTPDTVVKCLEITSTKKAQEIAEGIEEDMEEDDYSGFEVR